MSLSRWILASCLIGLFAGCSDSDPFSGDPEAEYERLCGEACERIAEVAEYLATIEDEASLESALPRIRSAMDEVVKAIEKQNEILASGYRPSEAIVNKFKAKLAEITDTTKLDIDRIAGLRGFEKIKTELLRATKVPKPPMRSQAASGKAGSKVSKQVLDDLKTLGRVYHHYLDAHQKVAASWEEATAFCRTSGDTQGAEALGRLKEKGVVVHWGIRFQDARVGSGIYVFAYEKKTPMEGGAVLHLDGSVQTIIPGELLTYLAFQADNDLAVFGKTPPFPIKFAPGTTPEFTRARVPLNLSKPWPPDNPIIGVQPASVQPAPKAVSDNRSSTGANLPPALGRGADSPESGSKRKPSSFGDSADSEPDMSSPFSRGGMAGGPFRPERPITPGRLPRTPFGAGESTDGGFGAADGISEGRRPPVSFRRNTPQAESATSVNTVDSPLVGGSGGSARRTVDREGRPMIGVRYRLGSWAGKDAVQSFDPIFDRSRPQARHGELYAKDGYAVGAIQVDGDEYVYAIRVAFMRIEGGRLDQKDSYVSEWIGVPTGLTPKTLNGNGAFVVGVHGRGAMILDAVGLVFKAE